MPSELYNGGTIKPTADGETVRALGVPIGNAFSNYDWWEARYRTVKARVAHWTGLGRLTLVGRNMLLQSIIYGSLRYWFFTLPVPPELVKLVESDAHELLWAAAPVLDADSLGTQGSAHRYIYEAASYLPRKKGGGGIMHLPSHIKAFQAQWIIKYLDPRTAPWKDVLDHWLIRPDGLGRGTILSSRQADLAARLPPHSRHMRACLDAFAELNVKQNLEILDHNSQGEPLWQNNRFPSPLDRSSVAEWVRRDSKHNDSLATTRVDCPTCLTTTTPSPPPTNGTLGSKTTPRLTSPPPPPTAG